MPYIRHVLYTSYSQLNHSTSRMCVYICAKILSNCIFTAAYSQGAHLFLQVTFNKTKRNVRVNVGITIGSGNKKGNNKAQKISSRHGAGALCLLHGSTRISLWSEQQPSLCIEYMASTVLSWWPFVCT